MDQKLLFFITCFLCIGGTFADVSGQSFWKLNSTDQFMLIFDYLGHDANLTLRLLNIVKASSFLLSGGKENASALNLDSPVVYYFLDKAAELLQNPDFLYIAAIVEDEVSKVKICHMSPDHPDLLVKYVLANTDYQMILHRILHRKPSCITHP